MLQRWMKNIFSRCQLLSLRLTQGSGNSSFKHDFLWLSPNDKRHDEKQLKNLKFCYAFFMLSLSDEEIKLWLFAPATLTDVSQFSTHERIQLAGVHDAFSWFTLDISSSCEPENFITIYTTGKLTFAGRKWCWIWNIVVVPLHASWRREWNFVTFFLCSTVNFFYVSAYRVHFWIIDATDGV